MRVLHQITKGSEVYLSNSKSILEIEIVSRVDMVDEVGDKCKYK